MIKAWISNEYITIPPMKRFCKENKLGSIINKEDGLNTINEFANQSKGNYSEVLNWIEYSIKEGNKSCYIKRVIFDKVMMSSELFWQRFIHNIFEDDKMKFINEASFTDKLSIFNVTMEKKDEKVTKVYMTLGKLVYEYTDLENVEDMKIPYPIFITLDIESNTIEIRVKSKSRIYVRKSGITEGEVKRSRVTADKTILEVYNYLRVKIGFNEEALDLCKDKVYTCYYKILSELTETPQEIVEKIESKDGMIKNISRVFFKQLGLDQRYMELAKEDLKYWLEKYISLSVIDKNIFIEGKDGYPVKLISTDSEDTTIEETSSNKEPLQTKASYFDHKKILQREQLCDGMNLAFKRKNTLYFGREPFIISMGYFSGFSVIKFMEYVEEGDIQNVLYRVIANL